VTTLIKTCRSERKAEDNQQVVTSADQLLAPSLSPFKQPFCHDLSQLLLRFHDGGAPGLGAHYPTPTAPLTTLTSLCFQQFAWPPPPCTDTILTETCNRVHDRRPATEVAMDKKASPDADEIPQTSPEAPFTTFIQLDGRSTVPSQFHVPGDFYDHSAPVAGWAS
jgi:hypothetical protein